jgi:hypothetical protein
MRSLLACVVGACLWPLLALAGEPGSARKLNPDLLKLPANTWVHIRPARNPVARSYSGICHGEGLIYYFGGGHGSYPCNDVELYDVATNTWTQATEPEDWRQADSWTHLTPEERKHVRNIGGGSGVALLSPKGRPLTRHTYQMQCYFPEEKAFFTSMDQLWAFDPSASLRAGPAKRDWRKVMDKAPRGRDVHTWNLTYDPDLKTLVSVVVGGPDRAVYVFDRDKTKWSKRCDVPVTAWSEVYSTYDASRRLHTVRAGKRWWTLDMATGTTRFIADLGEAWMKAKGRDKPPRTESVSIEYDPESARTLVLFKGDGTELWAYEADKDAWSEVKMAGEPPKGTTDWDLLVYAPDHRCFLFLNVLGVQDGARADGLFAFRCQRVEERR